MTSLFVLFICALLAFSLSAVCGGGAGLLLMPVIGLYQSSVQLPATLSIGTAASSLSRLTVFYSSIRWSIVKWFVPAALPAVLIGAFLLRYINPLYLEIVMGLFLIGNLPALLKKSTSNTPESHSSYWLLIVIGFLAGFLSGLTGAVGLLFNRFYLKYGLSKEEIVATRAANEIILHITKLGLYASFGLLTESVIVMGIVIAAAGLLSSWIMKWGLKKISEVFFRKIGYGAMVISGVVMLTQSTTLAFNQNNGALTFSPFAGGIESKLQWQNANLAIEFEYNEGLEYEHEIPFAELTPTKQKHVLSQKPDSDKIIIEEVFGIGTHSFEAYYFKNNHLVKKIDF